MRARIAANGQDAVAQAETSVNVGVVAIYKALGGVGQPDTQPQQVARNP